MVSMISRQNGAKSTLVSQLFQRRMTGYTGEDISARLRIMKTITLAIQCDFFLLFTSLLWQLHRNLCLKKKTVHCSTDTLTGMSAMEFTWWNYWIWWKMPAIRCNTCFCHNFPLGSGAMFWSWSLLWSGLARAWRHDGWRPMSAPRAKLPPPMTAPQNQRRPMTAPLSLRSLSTEMNLITRQGPRVFIRPSTLMANSCCPQLGLSSKLYL